MKWQSEKKRKTSIKQDTSVDSSQYKRLTGTWSLVVRTMASLAVCNSAADTLFWYSFKILPDRLKLIRLYPCWVSLAKYQFRLRSSSWPFCSDSPEWRSRHMVTWFGRHGDAFGTTENAFISCIYDPQITVSPTSSFSVSFNGNRVKNHP